MAARKILLPGFLALALLGLLVTAPLVSADDHDDDEPDDKHVYQTTGTKPTKHDPRKTVKGWKKDHDLEEFNEEYYYTPPKGYWIKDVDFKKFNKKYTKAYFKIEITNGKNTRDREVFVKNQEEGAVFTRIFYSWNHYTLYFNTYYVYPSRDTDDHDDDDDGKHVSRTTGTKPSKDDPRKTVKGWKKGHDLEEFNEEYYYTPPKGYWIKDVELKKFNKKYTKAYFKIEITNGKNTRDREVFVKNQEKGAVFTRIFYSWNRYTLYFSTYYVYPSRH